MEKQIILTGDRPTGQLHLGHYVGSLENRVKLQDTHKQFVMIADMQALTDNADNPQKVRDNVIEVAMDYLAVGLDPSKTTMFIQSAIPELNELTMFYLNLVSVARLQRNPTVKNEMQQKGFGADVPAGFLMYPVSQAADITAFKAHLVPVGEDQLPVIEQTNEIVRKFNSIYGEVLVETKGVLSSHTRLAGLDGKAKMSKSLGNAIYLADDADSLKKKVFSMFTDPEHIRVEDPGKVEGNMVFSYLDVFGTNKAEIDEMKAHYQRGGLGDMKVKRYLLDVLEAKFAPIRDKRQEVAKDKAQVMEMIRQGSIAAKQVAAQTLDDVRNAIGVNYFK
ncbi:MAG: tryptophan--tRNA ligase [Neisseriaceae bacterium]|nr:MAG: tryptophan--tRNA ligase [Neisseriaceae bacterium]